MPHHKFTYPGMKERKKKRSSTDPTEKGEENIGIKAAMRHKERTGKSIWESIREGYKTVRKLGKKGKKDNPGHSY